MKVRILARWAVDSLAANRSQALTLVLTALFLIISDTAFAATITAKSCNTTDVQAAITTAASGDTVVVPNGTCTWTSGISINAKAIVLMGASKGGVTLVDRVPDGTEIVKIVESTAGHIEVMNLTFDSRGTSHGSERPTFHVSIFGAAGGRAVLIHDNTHLFATGGGVNAYHSSVNRGVIYRNQITAQMPGPPGYRNTFSAIRCKNAADLAGWESPSTLGTLDTTGEMNLYFEDNVMTQVHEGTDFDDACRIVFRYNRLNDANTLSHGWDSSPLGSRQVEIYGNTYTYGATGADGVTANLINLINIRGGGVWVIHDNVIPNLWSQDWGGDMAEMIFVLYGIRSNQCYTGGYQMYHQQGQGHDGMRYISDPVYIWNNTQPGGLPSPKPAVGDIGDACGNNRSTAEFVQLNRDYFLSPKPGYTPYSYPHPLRSGTSGSSQLPAPPTNVRIAATQ